MDRRTRMRALGVALLVLVAGLGLQAAMADPAESGVTRAVDGVYPGRTLITVQSYGWFGNDNGRAFIVNRSGSVIWLYDPPNSRVFDAEALDNGHILVSVATHPPVEACPEEDRGSNGCVHNRVVEIDPTTNDPVWSYAWYDEFINHHEVHDADRLPSGETAIVDMGNNRAFTVARNGTVTWMWHAENHIGEGTEFWERYVPADRRDEFRKSGPESDWTHMNDIDRLENGNFQLSIRNFDVVLEVNPGTNEIVDVVGRPGNTTIMNEQHDPHRIGERLLVADSENDRIVSIDADRSEVRWVYTGGTDPLRWPRDADRLPNGNTLIADSLNFRVIEINATGAVLWEYSLRERRGIVYDADRLGLPEEPEHVPRSGHEGDPRWSGPVADAIRFVETWSGFVFPAWVLFPELLNGFLAVLAAAWLLVEGALLYRDRDPGSE